MTVSQDILKKMMGLPHRGAGTEFEKKAGEYIKNVYSYFGLQAKEVASSTIPHSLVNHLIISSILILITIAINFLNIGIITLVFFIFTILVYLRLFNLPFRFVKKRSESSNIYTEIPAKSAPKYTLVVTSHYDTSSDLSGLFSILGPIGKLFEGSSNSELDLPDFIKTPLVIINLALGVTLISLFIPDNYAKFFFGFIVGIPLIIGIYLLNKSKKKYSPGAYDNGVGTSLIIELAANLSKNPLNNTKVIFANTAASNTLTKGTLPLLNSLNLEKVKTFILDINCIGEEQLVLFSSEPSYPLGLPVPFDSSFEVLADFAEDYFGDDFRVKNSTLPSTNQDLILNGYRVTGMITTMPKNSYPKNFNSATDTIEKIKWDKVEVVRDFVTGYMNYFDEVTREVNL